MIEPDWVNKLAERLATKVADCLAVRGHRLWEETYYIVMKSAEDIMNEGLR